VGGEAVGGEAVGGEAGRVARIAGVQRFGAGTTPSPAPISPTSAVPPLIARRTPGT
jgi:hypothetical protein